jgi:hypothetical protein
VIHQRNRRGVMAKRLCDIEFEKGKKRAEKWTVKHRKGN